MQLINILKWNKCFKCDSDLMQGTEQCPSCGFINKQSDLFKRLKIVDVIIIVVLIILAISIPLSIIFSELILSGTIPNFNPGLSAKIIYYSNFSMQFVDNYFGSYEFLIFIFILINIAIIIYQANILAKANNISLKDIYSYLQKNAKDIFKKF